MSKLGLALFTYMEKVPPILPYLHMMRSTLLVPGQSAPSTFTNTHRLSSRPRCLSARERGHTLFVLALSRHISLAANERPPYPSVLSILSGPPRCKGPLVPSQTNFDRAFLSSVAPNARSHIITGVGISFLPILFSLFPFLIFQFKICFDVFRDGFCRFVFLFS